jgi:hypothetical protein
MILGSNINDENDQSQPTGGRRTPLPDLPLREAEATEDASASNADNTETAVVVRSNDFDAEEEIEREFGIEGLDVTTPYLELSLLRRQTIQFATIVLEAEEKKAKADPTNMSNSNNTHDNHLLDDLPDGNRSRPLLSPDATGPHIATGNIGGDLIYHERGSGSQSASAQQGASIPEPASTTTLLEDASLAPTTEAKANDAFRPLLPDGAGEILKFYDVRGNRFDLSFHECRTWQVSYPSSQAESNRLTLNCC